MSNTNANVRSIRDKFQQPHQASLTKTRQEQKHDIVFPCSHCGKHQTISLLLPFNETQDFVEPTPVRLVTERYDSPQPSRNIEPTPVRLVTERYDSPQPLRNIEPQLRKVSPVVRQVSNVSDENDDLDSPLQRSNYALDFRRSSHDRTLQNSLEQNVKGFVDGCVRSSVHQVSYLNRDKEVPEIVEVDIEYDPVLGNVKSTRKRSSTMVTNLDRDYPPVGNRDRSVQNRFQPIRLDSELDKPPIWARRRTSHSTVKPSDLIREHDKKEKLDSNALRRLSRGDMVSEETRPNFTPQPTVSQQNPALIKETILRWCQEITQFYKGVSIRNFSSSWSNGLAFCAVIHRYFPDEFNFDTLTPDEPRQNFDLAFSVALHRAGIEPLIDTDDMLYMGNKPDSKVVFTYVQSLYRQLSRRQPPAMMRERW